MRLRYLALQFAFIFQMIIPTLPCLASSPKQHMAMRSCIVPDDDRMQTDGDDDAPSINRALAMLRESGGGDLCLMNHVYRIHSAIVQQDLLVHWYGRGWSESLDLNAGSSAGGHGTWLVIDRTDFQPITIAGSGSRGSTLQDIAITEIQPKNTGDTNWSPAKYPYAITVESTYGMVRFQNMMFYAVTAGINAHESGRLELNGIYGQVFDNLVRVDKSYDANRYNAIHLWPYWSQAVGVMSYTQKNLNALWLLRADTGTIDDVFVYGANSALRLDQSQSETSAVAGGAATKNTIGAVHCDMTRICVWVTGSNVNFQAGSIDSQGQEWTLPGSTPKPLEGVAAIRVDGQAVIQVGRVWQEFTDHSTFSLTNPNQASNIQVGSLYEDFRYADRSPATLTLRNVGDGGHSFSVSMIPMIVSRQDQRLTTGQDGTNAVVHIP